MGSIFKGVFAHRLLFIRFFLLQSCFKYVILIFRERRWGSCSIQRVLWFNEITEFLENRFIRNYFFKPGMMVHSYSFTFWETEVERLQIWAHPRQFSNLVRFFVWVKNMKRPIVCISIWRLCIQFSGAASPSKKKTKQNIIFFKIIITSYFNNLFITFYY